MASLSEPACLLYLDLHQRLGQNPGASPEGVRIAPTRAWRNNPSSRWPAIATVFSFSADWSLPTGTKRWPPLSTASTSHAGSNTTAENGKSRIEICGFSEWTRRDSNS
jgi:hypothetical protein